MRTFVGGIGYRDLRDHSVGVWITDLLMQEDHGPDVVVEDASYNPIALVQRLQDEAPGRAFDRAILVTAAARGGLRLPGSITVYRWDGELPDVEEIQRAVADGVTGIINADNTAIVCRHFGALPAEIVMVEIEPLEHEFGDELSAPVAAAAGPACDLIRRLAVGSLDSVPAAPLGGAAVASVGAWPGE